MPSTLMAENAGGVADSNTVGRDVLNYDGTGADDRPFADGHARKNATIKADPDVRTDADRMRGRIPGGSARGARSSPFERFSA